MEATQHDIDGLVDALVEDARRMIVSLLTDYGTEDDFVGVCHGVIASIAPDARIIDVTHGDRRASTCATARSSCTTRSPTCRRACTWPSWTPRWAPSGARSPCAATTAAAGGARQRAAVAGLARPPAAWRPPWTSPSRRTAWSRSRPPSTAATCSRPWPRTWRPAPSWPTRATPLDPDALQVRRAARGPIRRATPLVTRVLYVDGFGNVSLNAGHGHIVGSGLTLGGAVEVTTPAGNRTATFASTFADVRGGRADRLRGRPPHGSRWPSTAARAATTLGLERDDEVGCARDDRRPRVHHRVTDSTNERGQASSRRRARPTARSSPPTTRPPGAVAPGRSWVAQPGAVIGADVGGRSRPAEQPLLPLSAAVAVCDVVARAPGRARSSGPTTCWWRAARLAGILVEGRPQDGLGGGRRGPQRWRRSRPSWRNATRAGRRQGDRARCSGRACCSRPRWTADGPPAPECSSAWRERDALLGRRIALGADGSGTAAGVDDAGALLVDTGEGRVALRRRRGPPGPAQPTEHLAQLGHRPACARVTSNHVYRSGA